MTISDPQHELRQRFIQQSRLYEKRRAELEAAGVPLWELTKRIGISFAPFAELRCGARAKRSGKPCTLVMLYGNGRCKFHGGLSTGPKTESGKARSAANGARRRTVP